ncbi:MAG: EamA family transporter [Desulfonatronovibrionaceae bacterium]
MWVVLSFLTAVCEAAKDGLCKKSLTTLDVLTISWAWKALSLPFILPLLLFTEIPDQLPARFWWSLAVGGSLNILATVIYIKALEKTDLSIALPLLSFTPVFLLVTSPVMVGDRPGEWGYLGVLFIFAGSYLLGIRERQTVLSPLKALFRDQGARLMLVVALIWSLAANVDKTGVLSSSPFFWAVSVQSFIAAGLSIILWVKRPARTGLKAGELKLLFLTGLFTGAGLIFQMSAISTGLVPYVIAIKRTSIVMGVLAGGWLFMEKDLKIRLAASVVMLAGVIIIAVLS